jgi:phosphonate transport system substrate-binding protein
MKTSKWLRVLALLASLALVAAACGSDDEAADTATESEEADASSSEDDAATSDTEAPAEDSADASDEAAAAGADWPDTIRFAAVPSVEEEQQIETYQPIIDILSEELGIEVEFSFATSYAAVIESMIAGNLDMAQFGPFSYVIATGNGADLEPVAISTEEGVPPSYRSYGITSASNDSINSIEDFAGRDICFVDPGSTSGFLFPSAGLLSVDIDPETDVNGTFAGGHDASALSVANGTCEAGFAYDAMVTDRLIEQGDIAGVIDTVEDENVNPDEAELKIVWKGPEIPNSPVAVQASLPADLIAEIERVFVEEINTQGMIDRGMCTSVDDCVLGEEGAESYLPVDDSLYDGIRLVCEETGSAKCEN